MKEGWPWKPLEKVNSKRVAPEWPQITSSHWYQLYAGFWAKLPAPKGCLHSGLGSKGVLTRFLTLWPSLCHQAVLMMSPGNAKECSNYHTIALISHARKVMLKIFQAKLQKYMNHELPDVQAGFRKGRGTRDQIFNIHWIIKKSKEFQKNIYFCFIDYTKAFDCVCGSQ